MYEDLENAVKFISEYEDIIRKVLGCKWAKHTYDLEWDDGGRTVRLNAVLKYGAGHRIGGVQKGNKRRVKVIQNNN